MSSITKSKCASSALNNGPDTDALRLDKLFDGHHSEWWTLYRSTLGGDTLEDPFTVAGDTTGRTYTDFARGDFFQNVTKGAPDPDFNQDEFVNGEDFLIWQRGFGVGTSQPEGDADNNGLVNADDLAVWQSSYDASALTNVNSVPEPSGILLTLIAAASALARRS